MPMPNCRGISHCILTPVSSFRRGWCAEDSLGGIRTWKARRFKIDLLLGFCDRILMLYVYQKNERENLTEDQKKVMKQIAEDYRHE